jgi:hypothetical protein
VRVGRYALHRVGEEEAGRVVVRGPEEVRAEVRLDVPGDEEEGRPEGAREEGLLEAQDRDRRGAVLPGEAAPPPRTAPCGKKYVARRRSTIIAVDDFERYGQLWATARETARRTTHDLTAEDIEDVRERRRAEGCAASTWNKEVSWLRAFYRDLLEAIRKQPARHVALVSPLSPKHFYAEDNSRTRASEEPRKAVTAGAENPETSRDDEADGRYWDRTSGPRLVRAMLSR